MPSGTCALAFAWERSAGRYPRDTGGQCIVPDVSIIDCADVPGMS